MAVTASNEGFLHVQRVYTGTFTLAENIFWLMFLHEAVDRSSIGETLNWKQFQVREVPGILEREWAEISF